MPRILNAELERIAKENHWNCDTHTLYILGQAVRQTKYPGVKYAMKRAMKIVRKHGRK